MYRLHTYIITYIIDYCLLTLYSGIDAISSDSVEIGEDTFRDTSITSKHDHTYIHKFTCIYQHTFIDQPPLMQESLSGCNDYIHTFAWCMRETISVTLPNNMVKYIR